MGNHISKIADPFVFTFAVPFPADFPEDLQLQEANLLISTTPLASEVEEAVEIDYAPLATPPPSPPPTLVVPNWTNIPQLTTPGVGSEEPLQWAAPRMDLITTLLQDVSSYCAPECRRGGHHPNCSLLELRGVCRATKEKFNSVYFGLIDRMTTYQGERLFELLAQSEPTGSLASRINALRAVEPLPYELFPALWRLEAFKCSLNDLPQASLIGEIHPLHWLRSLEITTKISFNVTKRISALEQLVNLEFSALRVGKDVKRMPQLNLRGLDYWGNADCLLLLLFGNNRLQSLRIMEGVNVEGLSDILSLHGGQLTRLVFMGVQIATIAEFQSLQLANHCPELTELVVERCPLPGALSTLPGTLKDLGFCLLSWMPAPVQGHVLSFDALSKIVCLITDSTFETEVRRHLAGGDADGPAVHGAWIEEHGQDMAGVAALLHQRGGSIEWTKVNSHDFSSPSWDAFPNVPVIPMSENQREEYEKDVKKFRERRKMALGVAAQDVLGA